MLGVWLASHSGALLAEDGDPAGVEFEYVTLAAIDAVVESTSGIKGGLVFHYLDSSISGRDSIRGLTGLLSRQVLENWQLQSIALAGFTDSSLDRGDGFQLMRIL